MRASLSPKSSPQLSRRARPRCARPGSSPDRCRAPPPRACRSRSDKGHSSGRPPPGPSAPPPERRRASPPPPRRPGSPPARAPAARRPPAAGCCLPAALPPPLPGAVRTERRTMAAALAGEGQFPPPGQRSPAAGPAAADTEAAARCRPSAGSFSSQPLHSSPSVLDGMSHSEYNTQYLILMETEAELCVTSLWN